MYCDDARPDTVVFEMSCVTVSTCPPTEMLQSHLDLKIGMEETLELEQLVALVLHVHLTLESPLAQSHTVYQSEFM